MAAADTGDGGRHDGSRLDLSWATYGQIRAVEFSKY